MRHGFFFTAEKGGARDFAEIISAKSPFPYILCDKVTGIKNRRWYVCSK
jgi:hypothetical protein